MVFHKLEAILTPVDLVLDAHGRRAEYTVGERLVRQIYNLLTDLVGFGKSLELRRFDA